MRFITNSTPQMGFTAKGRWVFILLLAVVAIVTALITDPLQIGRRDLIAYWSGYRLFIGGQNPYLQDNLLLIQAQIPNSIDPVMPFRSPPWTITALSPVLMLPWGLLARIWFGLSLFSVGLLILLGSEMSKKLPSRSDLLALFAIQQPILACLYWGQLGIFQALAGTYLLQKERKLLLTVLALTVISLKPHPYYLFVLMWLLHSNWRQESKAIFLTGGVLLTLSVNALLINPNGFSFWWRNFQEQDPFFLVKPTIVDWLRLFFLSQHWLVHLSTVLPALMIVAAIAFRRSLNERLLFASIPLSFLTAPYCWPHDMVLLYIVLTSILKERSKGPSTSSGQAVPAFACILLGTLQLVAEILGAPPHVYVFVPLGVLLAMGLSSLRNHAPLKPEFWIRILRQI